MAAIETWNLRREFVRRSSVKRGDGVREKQSRTVVEAVRDLTLRVDNGESVAYLGPNGAGKSTTIKMLTGVLVPTSGFIKVMGLVPWKRRKANARNIGVVFGHRSQLWYDLPLRDSLNLIARLYGINREIYKRRLTEFVELLDIGAIVDVPVRSLSLGQRMRGDLVASLIHDPPVVFLDEPTIGLDIVAKERIRQFLRQRNIERGTTVFLTTHDISEIEKLCHRTVIVNRGAVVFDGAISRLRQLYMPTRELLLRVRNFEDWVPPRGIRVIAVGKSEVLDETSVTLSYDPRQYPTMAVIREVAQSPQIADLAVHEPSLESVIHSIYSEQEP